MKPYVIAVLVLVVYFSGYFTYQWKRNVDKRGYYAEQCGTYLFGATGLTDPQGASINRQQLFDKFLHDYVAQLQKK